MELGCDMDPEAEALKRIAVTYEGASDEGSSEEGSRKRRRVASTSERKLGESSETGELLVQKVYDLEQELKERMAELQAMTEETNVCLRAVGKVDGLSIFGEFTGTLLKLVAKKLDLWPNDLRKFLREERLVDSSASCWSAGWHYFVKEVLDGLLLTIADWEMLEDLFKDCCSTSHDFDDRANVADVANTYQYAIKMHHALVGTPLEYFMVLQLDTLSRLGDAYGSNDEFQQALSA